MYAAAVWLKARPDSTGRLGATGFCYGGGVANQLAVRMGADIQAVAPFYGQAPHGGGRGEDQGRRARPSWRD